MITLHAVRVLLEQEGHPNELVLHPKDWWGLVKLLYPVTQEAALEKGFVDYGGTHIRRSVKELSDYTVVDKSAAPVDWDALYTERV